MIYSFLRVIENVLCDFTIVFLFKGGGFVRLDTLFELINPSGQITELDPEKLPAGAEDLFQTFVNDEIAIEVSEDGSLLIRVRDFKLTSEARGEWDAWELSDPSSKLWLTGAFDGGVDIYEG